MIQVGQENAPATSEGATGGSEAAAGGGVEASPAAGLPIGGASVAPQVVPQRRFMGRDEVPTRYLINAGGNYAEALRRSQGGTRHDGHSKRAHTSDSRIHSLGIHSLFEHAVFASFVLPFMYV